MKQPFLFFTYFLLLTACNSDDDVQTISPNQDFNIGLGESVIIKADKDFQISMDEIEDSRCPSDAVCIWYGFARAKASIIQNETKLVELELCLGQCDDRFVNRDSAEFDINDKTLSLVLKEINPYPTANDKPTNKSAKLMVIE